jgi:hypothetical protein
MHLRRVEIPTDSTFYVLFECIDVFRKLSHVATDRHDQNVVDDMLDALRHAAAQGWFYVNPRNDAQLIAYCGDYRKPFWFVVASADREGFKAIEKDYAVITCLGHRDSKFHAAIHEHRALVGAEEA